MTQSNLLTKSRLASFRSCQRLHEYKYLRGYRPITEAGALGFGTLVHEGLEKIWRAGCFYIPEEADPFDAARANAMLSGYMARWFENDISKYQVIGIEIPFECDLKNPMTGARSKTWRLAGKLDGLVKEQATGRVWIVEHKTAGVDVSVGSSYWAKLRMDTQVSVYYAGAQSLGYDPYGVIYDVLSKPKLRPYEVSSKRAEPESAAEFEKRCADAIAEAPDSYYQRGSIVRLEEDMTEAMLDIWQTASQMRDSFRMGFAPRNPDACEKWGRVCDFFPVCCGETSLSNQRLYRLSSTLHPELTGPSKEVTNNEAKR